MRMLNLSETRTRVESVALAEDKARMAAAISPACQPARLVKKIPTAWSPVRG